MKNQKIEKVVNPFIRIAGTQALLWGALGLVVSTLLSRLSLSWIITLRACSQSCLVVLLGRASDCVVSSGNPVLYRRKDIFPFQNPYGRCLRNCLVRSITDDRNESDLFITPYASDRTSRFYNGTY